MAKTVFDHYNIPRLRRPAIPGLVQTKDWGGIYEMDI
jgi:hypothetical protein